MSSSFLVWFVVVFFNMGEVKISAVISLALFKIASIGVTKLK